MNIYGILNMIFSVGSIFGGLFVMLYLAIKSD